MKHSLQLRLSQHLTLTPQLQQSIRLLQLSTLELTQELERILQENPLLEREDGIREQPVAQLVTAGATTPGETTAEESAAPEAAAPEPENVEFSSLDDAPSGPYRDDAEDGEYQQVAADAPTLRVHLLSQLSLTNLSERDRRLVALIIDSLDDDGYLTQTEEELLAMLPPELEIEPEELHIALKHLQNLVDLQKDKTYDYSGRDNKSEGRFTSGECPIMLTSSGFYGNVKANAKFDFTSAPMPYYPEAKGAPQNSIIGGASLWVMGGKSEKDYKGVAKFFAFLSDTDRQAKLHQESGYLPITKAAYEKTKASGFYEKNPVLQTPLLELTNKEPTENSRGLRFGNMVQIRDVISEEIEAALAGQKPAKDALDSAVTRSNQILRQFERTVR